MSWEKEEKQKQIILEMNLKKGKEDRLSEAGRLTSKKMNPDLHIKI